MLEKNAGDALFQELKRRGVTDSCSDNQDASFETYFTRPGQESRTTIFAEVKIEQDEVGFVSFQNCECFFHRAALADNFEVVLGAEKAAQTFTKQDVVVQQEEPNLFHTYCA